MAVQEKIRSKLEEAFAPDLLDIVDESEMHRGHAGFQEGGESHFRIEIRADAFASMSRIEQHRAIHTALGADILQAIHALSLKIRS